MPSSLRHALARAPLRFHDSAAQAALPPPRPRATPVSFYACGLTPYAASHIGHGRSFVVFDLLRRLLEGAGWPVRLIRNRTDIDDKIIVASRAAGVPWEAFAQHWAQAAQAEFAALGVAPAEEPRVSEHIDDIRRMLEILEAKGHAYRGTDGTLWFDTASFTGTLLRGLDRTAPGHRPASRVDQAGKRRSEDFALWKPVRPDEPSWPSPWGEGRPGWHIECSAIIHARVGATVDFHGGGVDLRFPHHQAEVLQSEAAWGTPLAHRWLHHGAVLIDGKKMAKSEGNGVLLGDAWRHAARLAPEAPGEVLRLALLGVHWQQPLDWTSARLEEAVRRWTRYAPFRAPVGEAAEAPGAETWAERVGLALSDNANLPLAFSVLDEAARAARNGDEGARQVGHEALVLLGWGAPFPRLEAVSRQAPDATATRLLAERTQARREKRWAQADALRQVLGESGWEVLDEPAGSRLIRRLGP